MTLREFVNLVSGGDGYKYVAIRRKGGFEGRTGEYWVDNAMGFSWCTRKGFGFQQGQDWSKGKGEVKSIEPYTRNNKEVILCAVIDQESEENYV